MRFTPRASHAVDKLAAGSREEYTISGATLGGTLAIDWAITDLAAGLRADIDSGNIIIHRRDGA